MATSAATRARVGRVVSGGRTTWEAAGVNVLDSILWPVARWSDNSQRRARDNAMEARRELVLRRHERDEVARFLTGALDGRAREHDMPTIPEPRRG